MQYVQFRGSWKLYLSLWEQWFSRDAQERDILKLLGCKNLKCYIEMVWWKLKKFLKSFCNIRTCHFRKTSCNEVEKIISNLSNKKSCQQEDTPTKTIKLNKYPIAKFIAENLNSCIDKGEFPPKVKHADIVLIYEKKYKSDRSNYRQ